MMQSQLVNIWFIEAFWVIYSIQEKWSDWMKLKNNQGECDVIFQQDFKEDRSIQADICSLLIQEAKQSVNYGENQQKYQSKVLQDIVYCEGNKIFTLHRCQFFIYRILSINELKNNNIQMICTQIKEKIQCFKCGKILFIEIIKINQYKIDNHPTLRSTFYFVNKNPYCGVQICLRPYGNRTIHISHSQDWYTNEVNRIVNEIMKGLDSTINSLSIAIAGLSQRLHEERSKNSKLNAELEARKKSRSSLDLCKRCIRLD